MKTKIYRRRGSISTLYLAVRDNIKKEDGLHYQLLKGQSSITSDREEGCHYQLFKGQSVVTSYREEGLHYQLFKGSLR
jgi:hypothetical protein